MTSGESMMGKNLKVNIAIIGGGGAGPTAAIAAIPSWQGWAGSISSVW